MTHSSSSTQYLVSTPSGTVERHVTTAGIRPMRKLNPPRDRPSAGPVENLTVILPARWRVSNDRAHADGSRRRATREAPRRRHRGHRHLRYGPPPVPVWTPSHPCRPRASPARLPRTAARTGSLTRRFHFCRFLLLMFVPHRNTEQDRNRGTRH